MTFNRYSDSRYEQICKIDKTPYNQFITKSLLPHKSEIRLPQVKAFIICLVINTY